MQDYHHMWESELAAEEVAKTAGWLIRSHQPQIDRDFLVDLCPECQVAEAIRTVSEEPWEE